VGLQSLPDGKMVVIIVAYHIYFTCIIKSGGKINLVLKFCHNASSSEKAKNNLGNRLVCITSVPGKIKEPTSVGA